MRRSPATVSWVVLGMFALSQGDPADSAEPHGRSTSDIVPVQIDDALPYAQSPIDYHAGKTSDRLAEWDRRRGDDGRPTSFDQRTEYLQPLLEALSLPKESQVLVFSKTAVNTRHVSPQTPRAIYFDDEVYAAWIPGAPTIELAAVDPVKGFMFYAVTQDAGQGLNLRRERSCLTCHVNSATLNVPGLMLRSMSVDEKGKPYEGFPRTTHATPYHKRWGGWYVTDAPAEWPHLGNLIGKEAFRKHKVEPGFRGPLATLSTFCDLSAYPRQTSDIVPLLVFNHQAHGQNLILRAGYEARLGVKSTVEEELFRYLLFLDEPPLPAPVTGSTAYREWFAAQGPADDAGRSLREFDLSTRLFRYRLSYLVASRPFRALPDDVKERLYGRIRQALAGEESSVPESWHTPAERAALSSLLKATLDDFHPLPAGEGRRAAAG